MQHILYPLYCLTVLNEVKFCNTLSVILFPDLLKEEWMRGMRLTECPLHINP